MKMLSKVASLTLASVLAFAPVAMATGYHKPPPAPTPAGSAVANANAAAQASSNAVNGPVTTGPSTATTGSVSLQNTFGSNTPMGVAPPVFIAQSGNCSEGAMGGVSAPYVGISFGKTGQDTICLAKEAAQQLINQGIILKDDSMIVGGIAALRAALPKVDQGLRTAIENLLKECAPEVSSKGMRILLTDTDFSCKKGGGFELKKPLVEETKVPEVRVAPKNTGTMKP